MKKIVFLSFFILIVNVFSAQKISYVDTDYILKNMPEYQTAQKQLDARVEQWGTEVQTRKDSIQEMEIKFENQKILLTENQILEKQIIIDEAKSSLEDFKVQKFGAKGEVIRTRQSLVRPIQDQVWNAVNKIAKQKSIGIVLDKASSDLTIIYSDPKLDITSLVMKEVTGKQETQKKTNNNNK